MRIVGLLIFFGAGLSLLMAVSQLISTERKTGNTIIALLFAVLSLVLAEHYITIYWNSTNTLSIHNLMAAILFEVRVLKYSIGPLFLLYILSLINSNYSVRKIDILHFVPFIMVSLFFLYIIVDVAASGRTNQNLLIISEIILIVSFIHIIIYILYTLREIRITTIRFDKKHKTFTISLFISILIIIILIPVLIFTVIGSQWLESIGVAFVSVLIIIVFLVGQRYPEFIQWFSREVKKNRYERSLVKGLDTGNVLRRLTDLMEEEKLFCDEDLTLQRLADHLTITTHQLSELLNNNLDSNFNSYLNLYRINEAKKLLIEEPERSILSIAYSVGFNSKSVFYNAFTKIVGTSPTKHREDKISSL